MIPLLAIVVMNPGPPGAQRVDFGVLSSGFMCKMAQETVIVCSSQDQLDEAVKELGVPQEESLSADFKNKRVVVVCGGERPTAGYALEPLGAYELFYNAARVEPWQLAITPLIKEDGLDPELVPYRKLDVNDVLLVIKQSCPPPGALVAQMITHPFVIVEIPKPKGEIKVSISNCKANEGENQ